MNERGLRMRIIFPSVSPLGGCEAAWGEPPCPWLGQGIGLT